MNKFFSILLIFIVLLFTACSTRNKRVYSNTKYIPAKSYSSNKEDYSTHIDKKTYTHPTMKPYIIRGIKYYPTVVSVGDTFSGRASWYGPAFHGKKTSNGERYNMYGMTAAHKTLPMNTIVKVTNQNNDLSVVVRINDRGPFVNSRIIDLSKTAANKINMIAKGTAPVEIKILGFETKGKKLIPTKKEMKKAPQKKSITGFAIQIASFSNIEGALKTQEAFDNKDGYSTVIKDTDSENGRIFKVWLKGFKSENEARDYKSQGHFENAFIVKEE